MEFKVAVEKADEPCDVCVLKPCCFSPCAGLLNKWREACIKAGLEDMTLNEFNRKIQDLYNEREKQEREISIHS